MRRQRLLRVLAVAMAALIQFGCGGGGGGSGGSASVLKGTAATGAAIVGAVQVTDANGVTRRTNIGPNGSYSIDISGLTAPYVLVAEGTVGNKSVSYYAPATADDINGNINITPLSDLMLANIANDVAGSCAASPACVSALTTAGINAARNALATRLGPTLQSLGLNVSLDLLRAAFTAGSQIGIDALLDVLDVTIDNATKIAVISNLASGDSVTDDLTDPGDDDTELTAGDAEATTMTLAIRARLVAMDAIIASTASVATKTSQLEAFCTDDFLSRGSNCQDTMSHVAEGGGFPSWAQALERIGPFDVTGVDGIDDVGTLDDQHVGAVMKIDTRMGMLWRRNAADGKYYLAGDRLGGKYLLMTYHGWDADAGSGESHIRAEVLPTDVEGNLIADTVMVAGPGLPAGIDFVPAAGNPYGFERANLGDVILEAEYTLADVKSAVTAKSPYMFTVKNGNTTVATYRRTLVGSPLVHTALAAVNFASVSNVPTLSLCRNGGTWAPIYVRNGLRIENTSVACMSGSNDQSVEAPDREASSLAITAMPSATQMEVRIDGIDDVAGRNFSWVKHVSQ